jgi:hypothetical protein
LEAAMSLFAHTLMQDIRDLSRLFRSPGSFFQKVSAESGAATLLRLLMYGVLFDLLFAVLLVPEARNPSRIPLSYALTFGICAGFLAIIPGAILFLITRLLSPRPGFKVVIAYAVMGKLFLLTPAVICFALYLFKESVPLLAIRGTMVWLGSLLIAVACPFLIAASAKRRWLVSLLSLVVQVAVNAAVILAVSHSGPKMPAQVSMLSFLYDPVAAEMERYTPTDFPQVDLSRLLPAQELSIRAIHVDSSGTARFNLGQIQASAALINDEARVIGSYVRTHLGALPPDETTLMFAATKEVVRAMKDDYASLASLSDGISVKIPKSESEVLAVLASPVATSKGLDKHLESHFKLISLVDSNVLSRYRLRKFLLAVW